MGRKSKIKRERNTTVEWTPFIEATSIRQQGVEVPLEKTGFQACFVNSLYTVLVRTVNTRIGLCAHLSIRRNDRRAIHDWRHLQRIKNEIVGPECEAAELYPAESRLVDGANQFHLWCFEPSYRFPFGFERRDVLDANENPVPGAVQRAFGDENL